ncbi:MAG: 1,4-dihydroxy-2-naphthoate polyprenyltransferase [Reichenbachiella sp.]
MRNWISAFRLRTLPLALSSILMGNFLAFGESAFNWTVGIFSVLTTVFLQVLSNLANDYGDTIHGADSKDREGPSRTVQSGLITLTQMKRAIWLFTILSFLSGSMLLLFAFQNQWHMVVSFLLLGLAAIYAAITYTAGKNPYGYVGLGDISVFLFFGLVGVMGSYFLQTKNIDWVIILPAISCGMFATGVLNVNNIRDIDSDINAGKRSIPVRIGRKKAVVYHASLLILGWISMFSFLITTSNSWINWLVCLTLPLFIINFRAVSTKLQVADLDPYLKQLAISTLFFVLLFGFSKLF